MLLDPEKLAESSPAEILEAVASGHLGLDHRFLHSLLDRSAESLPAVIAFSRQNHTGGVVDLSPELTALFHFWKAPEGVPFLISSIKDDPENVPDEIMEAFVAIGPPALEPLLGLYAELEESQNGEIAFILSSLGVRDSRILNLLVDRMEYQLDDAILMLGIYGDPAAIPKIESIASRFDELDSALQREITETIESLRGNGPSDETPPAPDPFDIYALYPETADAPIDLLDEDERAILLTHPVPAVRAAAAASFFNSELSSQQRIKILTVAKEDCSSLVRARAWEALMDSTEDAGVIDSMLEALRNPALPVDERAGLLVGLSAETDRNEVRHAMLSLYAISEARAKALEAMWRSLYPGFRDYFAKHLDDRDIEVRRNAVWGVGYYGVKSELEKLRKLFDDEDLRSDALFAYTLALPGDVSRSRVKGLLARIEKDARGLSKMEEDLVRAALDERLLLAGKEPVFRQQED